MSNETIASTIEGVASDADPKSLFQAGKAHVAQAASEFKSAATAKATELKSTAEAKASELRANAEAKAAELRSMAEAKTAEFREKAGTTYEEYSKRYRTAREDGEQYVRENPTKAVLCALGVGFVLGLIIRR